MKRHRRDAPVIRIELQVDLDYEVDDHGADFIFNIHAAHTQSQTISHEHLLLSQAVTPQIHTDPVTGNRYMRLRAQPGPLKLSYSATVDLMHHCADPTQLVGGAGEPAAAAGAELHLPEPLLPVGPARQVRDPRVRRALARAQPRAGDPATGCSSTS